MIELHEDIRNDLEPFKYDTSASLEELTQQFRELSTYAQTEINKLQSTISDLKFNANMDAFKMSSAPIQMLDDAVIPESQTLPD